MTVASSSEEQKKLNKNTSDLQWISTLASRISFYLDLKFLIVFLFSSFSELDVYTYACRSEKRASSS